MRVLQYLGIRRETGQEGPEKTVWSYVSYFVFLAVISVAIAMGLPFLVTLVIAVATGVLIGLAMMLIDRIGCLRES